MAKLALLVLVCILIASGVFLIVRVIAQSGKTEGLFDFETKRTPEDAIKRSKEVEELLDDQKEQARRDIRKAAQTFDKLNNPNE